MILVPDSIYQSQLRFHFYYLELDDVFTNWFDYYLYYTVSYCFYRNYTQLKAMLSMTLLFGFAFLLIFCTTGYLQFDAEERSCILQSWGLTKGTDSFFTSQFCGCWAGCSRLWLSGEEILEFSRRVYLSGLAVLDGLDYCRKQHENISRSQQQLNLSLYMYIKFFSKSQIEVRQALCPLIEQSQVSTVGCMLCIELLLDMVYWSDRGWNTAWRRDQLMLMINLKMLIILQINQSLMNKCRSQIKSPNELIELQRLFLSELQGLQHRVTPLELPFYNLACYIVELMNEYCKSPLEVSFNIFIVDYHLRKYSSPTEAYRRFVGFLNSWKKNAQSDECQLFLTFLCPSRNCKRQVRLFLKLRKVLLKTINQKILQEINLTHYAVTIIHTLNLISTEQKRLLTKKINEYFITKNVKYVNNAKFNSAIICEYLLSEIGNSSLQNYDTRLSKKFDTLMQPQYQPRHQDSSPQSPSSDKENSEAYEQAEQSSHKKSLVNLDHCLKELTILKQKDLQIDNRFRRLNLQKQGNK